MPSLARVYDKLARRIVPGHRHTQRVYHDWLRRELRPGCDWLDLGCGHQIMPDWVRADDRAIVAGCGMAAGIDLDLPSLRANQVLRDRVLGTLEQLPFASGSFDLVTANMVVEHVASPAAMLGEVRRVLRPRGRFLFHTPNRKAPAVRAAALTPDGLKKRVIWILEKRREEDVFPTHYRMNTPGDITALAAAAGLKVERVEQLNSVAVTAMLGPLAIPELLFMRALASPRLEHLRSNILAILAK